MGVATRAPPRNRQRSRLFFDIETSPCVMLVWKPGRKISVSHENIIRDPAIICVAWMWEGGKNVRSLTWDRRQSDKGMLQEFVGVMHEADEIVGHNSDRFDVKWIRAQCMRHNIPMAPTFTSIDTLKLIRSGFYYPSSRLDYLGQTLGFGGKKKTDGFKLWKQVTVDNDRAALRRMVAYCKQDVRLLARVWSKMNPYVRAKSHRGGIMSDCPECGSPKTIISNHRISAAGCWTVSLQCKDCGKYHTIPASRRGRPVHGRQ